MTSVFIPLDRPAAFIRALWRLLPAILIGALIAFLIRRIDWEQYWRDQRLVGLSWGLVLAVLAVPTIILAIAGLRWLLASLTPNLGVELNDNGLVLRGGPFGTQSLDWRRTHLQLDGDISVEVWTLLPADAVGISLIHPAYSGDAFDHIRGLLGGYTHQFIEALRERLHLLPSAKD
jgi:hypothetical protein